MWRQGFSGETLVKHSLLSLARYRGWLIAGMLVPLILAGGSLLWPFQLARQVDYLLLVFGVAAGWYSLFTFSFTIAHWLSPRPAAEADEIRILPLPSLQFLLHRLLDVSLVPLLTTTLTVPFFTAFLYYVGQPYQDWYRLFHGTASGWAWPLQAVLCLVILWNSVLSIITLACLVQEHFVSMSGRMCALAISYAGTSALGILWYQRLHSAYLLTQESGLLQPLALLLPVMALMALLLLLAGLPQEWRPRLLAGLLLLALLVVSLWAFKVMPEYITGTVSLNAPLQDLAIAVPYYVCHSNPLCNLKLVLEEEKNAVFIADHTRFNGIPQQLPVWVGTALLAPLWAVLAMAGILWGLVRAGPALRWTMRALGTAAVLAAVIYIALAFRDYAKEQHIEALKQESSRLRQQAAALYDKKYYGGALVVFKQMLTVEREVQDPESLGFCLNSIGNSYYYMEDYTGAVDYYAQSLAVLQAAGKVFGQAAVQYNLGSAYLKLEQPQLALERYQESQKLYGQVDELDQQLQAAEQAGRIAFDLKDYPAVYTVGLERLRLERQKPKSKTGMLDSLAPALTSLAWVEIHMRKYDDSIAHSREAFQISQHYNDYLNECSARWLRGDADAVELYRAGLRKYPGMAETARTDILHFAETGVCTQDAAEQLLAALHLPK